ncbi:hypothetical protein HDU76_012168 [Blyttiomyces sp. JEL0837]|nr:hypothetical protein HDU76_012168 [Blyttiomyces sp. JEL0837]
MIFVTLAAFIALSPSLALAGGLWDKTDTNSFDHVDGLVWGGIWNYDLKDHYDFDNRQSISWHDCVYWAKGYGNQIHAISYDTINSGCYLKQLPYNQNILSTFGGASQFQMYNTYVDSADFQLNGYYNQGITYEQCNANCANDGNCFSAEYDVVYNNCETRTLKPANGVFFTLPWWNSFPQAYPGQGDTGGGSDPYGCVSLTNQLRAKVGARSDLQWSDSLAQTAQNEVNQLVSMGCPNEDLSQGSNEFTGSPANAWNGPDWCQIAIKDWFNEGFDGSDYNHASQMTWSTTNNIGCAVASSSDGGCTSIVCHYDPIGNYIGVGTAPTFAPNLAG